MKKFLLSTLIFLAAQIHLSSQVASHVVLAEVYGGGGEQGSYWKNDYILLYNPTANPVDLSNWSVQYAVFQSSNWNVINLSGSIAAGGYYFIQFAGDGSGSLPLPFNPDVVSNINLDKNKGKIALANFQSAITVSNPIEQIGLIDFIGYGNGTNAFEGSGPAQQTSTTESIRRKDNDGNITYGVNGNGWDSNDNLLDFYLEDNLIVNPPLPVELTSFSAIVFEDAVKLKWRTETEISNYGFEILRSTQIDNWDVLGFVQGHGNSNSPKNYSFIDQSVSGGKYFYRLKQIDTDGQFEYSKIVEVDLNSPQQFQLSQNYPNPFNPTTTIKFSIPQSGNVKLTVYNLLGEEVAELIKGFWESGVHTVNFNASSLNSGVYIYELSTERFIQSRKMTLIK